MAGTLKLQDYFHKEYNLNSFKKDILIPVFSTKRVTIFETALDETGKLNPSEKQIIQKVSHYGILTLDDNSSLKLYEITLQPKVRIEQSKVSIQQYIRKILPAGDAALVNFINSDNLKTWRLTLIACDTIITEKGIKTKHLNSKRYTFIVGETEKCKTISDRFTELQNASNILLFHNDNEKNTPSLVKTFSVETLSKAFFEEYTLHYNKFIYYIANSNYTKSVFNITIPENASEIEIEKANKPIRDFVKKLLGRIVFLYFVQKKGWLGASTDNYSDGNNDFIFHLFTSSGANESFYPYWLSKLFFETLNKKRTNDAFTMPDGVELKIPYLNGGLFDPEECDNKILTFSSSLFHLKDYEDTPLVASLNKAKNNNHRGFLDFLNSFNFTVHEDSPDEHTVAVDPEMLGHIFENLLEDNKDKGAFYTPKEIVHYMCQESLIEYLTTHLSKEYRIFKDLGNNQTRLFGNNERQGQLKIEESYGDKPLNHDDITNIVKNKDINQLTQEQLTRMSQLLDDVKICDPAIGSGAFPMGLLKEIFAIKQSIALQTNKPFNPAKTKENIIQNSIFGVDIEKGAVDIARLRFWLSLVVDEIEPHPLPNLDFKIICANTLIPLGEIKNLDFNNTKEIADKLENIRHDYFNASKEEKALLESNFTNLQNELLNNAKDWISKDDNDVYLRLSQFNPFEESSCSWFDPSWMFGVKDGFDIVIGNPPYIQMQKDGGKLSKLYQHVKYETFERTGDIYSLFYEKGTQLLKENGVLAYITSNKWMRANYGASTRQFLANKTNPMLIIDFGNVQVFETATVDTNILFLQSKPKSNKHEIKPTFAVRFTNDFNIATQSINEFVKNNRYQITALNQNSWVVGEKDIYNIKEFVEKQGVELKDWGVKIYRGVLTGFNEAFIIDAKTKEKLCLEDPKSAEILKPILRGKDISAWYPDFAGFWLIATFPSMNIEIENYKAVKNFLLDIGKERLEQDGKGRKKTGNKWFETQDQISYWKNFENSKIVFPNMTKYMPFVFDESEHYFSNDKSFILSGKTLKYLTCFLNSKLFKYCFADNFPELKGGTKELRKVFFERVPVKQISEAQEKPFAIIVDYLVTLKRENSKEPSDQFMFLYFEQIANALVYELYFNDAFSKHNLEVAKYVEQLPDLDTQSQESVIIQIRKAYIIAHEQNNPIRNAVESMTSIPQINVINNIVSI